MDKKRPLDGIVVVDFCWAMAGPWFTKNLAENGATVIRIESANKIELNRRSPPYKDGIPGINRSGFFNYLNNDKFDISLNLRHPKGIEIAKRLIARADLVTENFSPGAMEKFGLTYDVLRKIKPDIIMVSLSMQGQTGPHSRYQGYGWLLQGISGMQFLSGYPDGEPVNPGPQLCDLGGAYFGVIAVAAALAHRKKTGEGQYIDLSQFEAAVHLLSPMFLDYSVNGHEAERFANRHPFASPHGVFHCKGDERWCAISVFSDAEWQSFIKLAANTDWINDPKFATLSGRKANEDELEKLVEAWCLDYSAEQVMAMLQTEGVAAGVVQNGKDMFEDPQLRWRGHYQFQDHLEVGRMMYENSGFRLSKTPAEIRRAAPVLGQDNDYIYREFLGISDKEFRELLDAGVFE